MADKAVVTQTTLDAIGQAIIAKGGATEPMTPAQMPAAIAALPSGGWTKPADWPDIREILANDDPVADGLTTDTTLANKIILLIECPYGITDKGINLQGGKYARTDDGRWITVPNAGLEIGLGGGNHWVIVYSDGEFTSLPFSYNYTRTSGVNGSVLWIVGNGATVRDFFVTNNKYLQSVENIKFHTTQNNANVNYAPFSGCESLVQIKDCEWLSHTGGFLTFQDCKSLLRLPDFPPSFGESEINLSGMCNGCCNLRDFPNVNLSKCTNAANMFNGCINLKEINAALNMPLCVNVSSMFRLCRNLEEVPAINVPLATEASYMFLDSGLLRITELTFGAVTNINSIFEGAHFLNEIPHSLDLSTLTGVPSRVNVRNYRITNFPTQIKLSYGIDLAFGEYMDPVTFATFGASGEIVSGFCHSLNVCPNAPQTITVPANLKAKFTPEQQGKIYEMVCVDKLWTLGNW